MVELKRMHDVEELLAYLESQWCEVTDIADLWDSEMDRDDKEVYQLEWSIKDDNLALLESQVVSGNLTARQYGRYKALRRMITRQRPVLERLFTSQ